MKLVTLTTDWGTSDFFAGMVKGRLYSLIPDVQVVDITHDIESYNLVKAAFILKNSCFNFPEGTIHIIDVDTYENKDCPYLVVECEKQYYIC
ncbi:MAG: SAM-dependent chlorinase/fluorinase, partial [Bacteroidales bacterium]|nr:SAM-dependent chlorinase/fluorinase [Bacteroidales bacterium]